MDIFDGRYEQEKLLGQGAFSEVWKVKDIQTGVSLALKIYNPSQGIDEDGNEMLTHEFALMVNASHKNLLRPLFFATCDKRPYLILPYCERGNIGKMIGKMTEDEAWRLLRDCASALAYLHAMNPPILHQDIKPANILLSDNGDFMLTDFGVSTQAKQSMSRVSNQDMALLSAGTISYMAPERFSRNNLPVMANDIYSLGSTVFEMLTGYLPFGNDGGLLQKKGADIPALPEGFSPLLNKTLEHCLQAEPWQRPTAEQLEETANDALRHPEIRNSVPETTPAEPEKPIIPNATTMQIPEEYLRDTTPRSSSQHNNALAGTVIGSSPHNTPSIPSYPPTAGQPKNTLLYSIIGVLAVAIIGVVLFLIFGNNGQKESAQESVIDTDSLMRVAEAAELETCMNLLRSNQADSLESALVRMKALAEKGNQQALHEVAYTYAPIPKDAESDRRKRLLGWRLHNNGLLMSADTNRQAIDWIERAITQSDSTDYQALYWLSSYYMNGIIVNLDFDKARQLLTKASNEAALQHDADYKNKIDGILIQIRQFK